MKSLLAAAAFAATLLSPLAASAQGYGSYPPPFGRDVESTGTLGGRAPWNAPWQYDSGSDQDRHPERPYYQQGGGQQTGGPARNLIPQDNLHIVPR